jgi:uncharacterized 2Fe-2S/4Fe-4S cluster protein (DUF4445 family)
MAEFIVKFVSFGKTVSVPAGTDLVTAAIRCGIVLSAACGGEGVCGKCKVIVNKGKVKTEASRFISAAESKKGMVLACQTLVEGNLEVTVPKGSLEPHEGVSHASEDFTKGIILARESLFRPSPLARKICVDVHHPTADDNTGDLDRICDALKPRADSLHISTRLSNVKHLSEVLRESDYKITATLAYKDGSLEILAFEPGDTSGANYGFAFDIGTTTVVGQLINLNTREILGTRISFNRQAAYGSDVITRIIYASEASGLEELNTAIIENMNEIIMDLAVKNSVSLGDINAIVCAGNMTMMHLLLKIDPSNIRKAPYVPTTSVFPAMHPPEIRIETNSKGIISFLPGVSTYIGGDIVSGILACGLSEEEGLSLLIDIGTNGEIVLGNREWMIGAAASAGPAFEGSGLSCGMKAVNGAIQKVSIGADFNVAYSTIGGDKPRGICGSGYIDLLCHMLKCGVIAKDGKINANLRSERIRKIDNVREFVIAYKKEAAAGRDIVINEDDIENLKRSKGAIYSAMIALLNKVGKGVADVKKVYLAGGFGNYLNIENSVFIGLLPDIDRGIYEFIGNSSLAGARMSLLSHEAFDKAYDIYKKITYLDLSSEPNYMDEYIAALFFPHTDIGRFPSVRS